MESDIIEVFFPVQVMFFIHLKSKEKFGLSQPSGRKNNRNLGTLGHDSSTVHINFTWVSHK